MLATVPRRLDKGCWEPTQWLDNHLGTRVLMDRPRGEFRTPVHTCQTIKQKAHALLSSAARHSRLVGAAWLASFAGLVLPPPTLPNREAKEACGAVCWLYPSVTSVLYPDVLYGFGFR